MSEMECSRCSKPATEVQECVFGCPHPMCEECAQITRAMNERMRDIYLKAFLQKLFEPEPRTPGAPLDPSQN